MPLKPVNIDASNFSYHEPESQEEGWPEYIVRNAAKIPAVTYSTARSGLGLGDILKATQGAGMTPEAKWAQKTLIPSYEEAREEISQILPEYFTKQRAGDKWAEFAAGEVLPALLTGGLKSLPAAAKYGLNTLKLLGASTLGSTAGSIPGQLLGNETLEKYGGLIGGLGAGLYAGAPKQKRPTQLLHQLEESAFESSKSQRLQALKDEAAPIIAERKKELRESILKFPKEIDAFESLQKKQIKNVEKEIKAYHQRIKDLEKKAQPLYQEAKGLAEGIKGPANDFKDAIKQAKRDIKIGLTSSERSDVSNNIKSLNEIIKKTKGSKDISALLPEVKLLKQRFNNQIYPEQRKGTLSFTPPPSRNFKSAMSPLVKSLNEFIDEVGGETHGAAWHPAEEATRELKLLKEGQKEFQQAKMAEIKDIKGMSYPAEREAIIKDDQRFFKQQLNDIEKTHNAELKSVANETFQEYLKSKDTRDQADKIIDTVKKYSSSPAAIGSMISALSYILGIGGSNASALGTLTGVGLGASRSLVNEIKAANEVFKSNPQLLREAGSLFAKESIKNIPQLVRNANALGSKISNESNVENNGIKPTQLRAEDFEFA